MRRALVTMVPMGGAPFTVGDPAVNGGSSATFSRLWVNRDHASPRAGTLTSIAFYAASAGSAYLITGALSGTTFTVTATTGLVALSAGLNTVPVSLTIASGDLIGWLSPSSGVVGSFSSASGSMSFVNSTVVPAPGGVYSGLSNSTGTTSIQGTGS